MIKFEKKQVKLISIGIALVFVLSIVGLAVSQSSVGFASAANSSSVGVVNYQQLVMQHPDMAAAQKTFQEEREQTKNDFESKSANMNEQEKAAYYQQLNQRLANRQKELMEPVLAKINEAIQAVADAKGISVVLDKNEVVYGGQDITADVAKKFAK
jgi:outer membrane protein